MIESLIELSIKNGHLVCDKLPEKTGILIKNFDVGYLPPSIEEDFNLQNSLNITKDKISGDWYRPELFANVPEHLDADSQQLELFPEEGVL